MTWRIDLADACHLPLADQSVDLVFGSPPYCDARSYGIGAQRSCQDWIDWMLGITREACRVSRGLVLWVCAGVQRDDYWPACEGLLYRWWAEGGHLWKPAYWHRAGIPGSGGRQWVASRIEYVMAFKHQKGRVPWADYKANGAPPKWNSGGKLSYRDANGVRRHKIRGTSGHADGDSVEYRASEGNLLDRAVTDIVNPGNLLTSCPMGPGAFVAEDGSPVLVDVVTGGGKMGHKLAHENEAPFPLKLAEWFIRGWCPPNGVVCDPFSGSGTTAHAALNLGRNSHCFDVRLNQVFLGRKRMREVENAVKQTTTTPA